MIGAIRVAAVRVVAAQRATVAVAALQRRTASAATNDPVKQLFVEKIKLYREEYEEDPAERVAAALAERMGMDFYEEEASGATTTSQ